MASPSVGAPAWPDRLARALALGAPGPTEAPRSLHDDAARRGEVFVARLRVGIYVVATAASQFDVLRGSPGAPRVALRIAIAVAVCALAGLLLAAARRGVWGRRLPYVSVSTDVTTVTAVVVASQRLGLSEPLSFLPLLLPSYLLVLAGTVLRLDARLCLFGGALALVQHEAAGLLLVGPGPPVDTFAGDARLAFSKVTYLAAGTLLAFVTVRHQLDLQRSATHDALTGLPNRSYFDRRLAQEHARAERSGEPYALVMADVDRFKALNDTAGHEAGDAALRRIAAALARQFRGSDLVARWGGDEFVVFLPGGRAGSLLPRLARVHAATSAEGRAFAAETGGEPAPPLGLSLGVASYPEDGASAEEVWRAADERLFRVKEGGGDGVAGPEPAEPAPAARNPASA